MPIEKGDAAVLVENAHGLWIRAKTFALTHESLRENKSWWFKQLARTTLLASIITVALSAFGFSREPATHDGARDTLHANSPEIAPDSSRIVWGLTGLAALLAAIAKLLEQHVGRQEDLQAHLHAELTLDSKMDSLKLLVARIMSYYDGTHPHELQELSRQFDVLAVEVGDTGKLVGVSPDKTKDQEARTAIANTSIDTSLSRVQTPEELPEEAPGIELLVRGGGE